jgi:hypothetical protein
MVEKRACRLKKSVAQIHEERRKENVETEFREESQRFQ